MHPKWIMRASYSAQLETLVTPSPGLYINNEIMFNLKSAKGTVHIIFKFLLTLSK